MECMFSLLFHLFRVSKVIMMGGWNGYGSCVRARVRDLCY